MKSIGFFATTSVLTALVIGFLALVSCREAAPEPPPPPPLPPPPPVPAPEPPPVPGKEITIDLSARNISFDKKSITVPVGARVTMRLTNNESFVFHNFAVYETSSATEVIFKGDFTQAGNTSNYAFPAPSRPGTYFFRCDVHPTLMTGDFIVVPEDGGT
ncbi:MAG: cupredoxin domain-containing protein [Chloroflexi bacterium]|nr:cupredoxin domain-containing protein [Chloroflexota bacterium]